MAATKSEQADAFEYKMQPIVLIMPQGFRARCVRDKQKEAEALRGRIQSCAEANAFFKAMPNAAIREIVSKTSADILRFFASCSTKPRSAI